MKNHKSKLLRKHKRLSEDEEIKLLNSWIEAQKPECGSNPLALPPLPSGAKVGRLSDAATDSSSFSRFSGVTMFDQLPISQKTKDGLRQSKYFEMTEIQRAALPHALSGRDVRGAAKTGSGKTLAFVIPVLEKLYREKYTRECGVGSIIITPTRELAKQIFDVLNSVGRYHMISAGILIGGRSDIDLEKECVSGMNILICTPGRLLQHMNETVNFDCSDLQVLVLDEADRILDMAFKKDVNAIISQLPKKRQTFLFSATQTKSVQDLERLSLKDPEYISVHEESVTATPTALQQTAMIVPLEEKMDMLWSFMQSHLNSKILVFLSSRKQVSFVFEAFKKLRPGIPLKCLHGKMKQMKRMIVYTQFCEERRSILFCTDVGSRGLDFDRAVQWVVQVDCPEDVKAYIHRVGRTARYNAGGRSVLFLLPSEVEMLKKLEAQKINIRTIKANTKRLKPVSGLLAALLVKYPDLQYKAQRALLTYLRSIHKNKDKEIFDVNKLPIDAFSASLGLAITPKIRFLNQKSTTNKVPEKSPAVEPESSSEEDEFNVREEERDIVNLKENVKKGSLFGDDTVEEQIPSTNLQDVIPATRVMKKKKLKINIHRPAGTRFVFDEEGNTLAPLARVADMSNGDREVLLDKDKKIEFYRKMREEMKKADKDDKLLDRNRRREKKTKEKMKRKRDQKDEEGHDDISDDEAYWDKKSKIYFGSDSDGDEDIKGKAAPITREISLEEQEALARQLLDSMNRS